MMVPPPSAARETCSPRRAKSADNIEGASSINLGLSGKIPKFYHAGERRADTLVRAFYNLSFRAFELSSGADRETEGRPPNKKERATEISLNGPYSYAGDDLLSHTLSRAVQSALRGLTSVFGMGTGGSPAV